MPLIRRRKSREGPEARRVTGWQVTLFFLAAGIWLVGVVADDTRFTGAAIVLLVAALVLRIIRDRAAPGDEPEPEDDTAGP
jgi:hypothetical protein